MENVEASAKNGPQHDNPDNFYVDLNNPELPELLQTIRELICTRTFKIKAYKDHKTKLLIQK